ncbi:MAG: OmpH family outer membrane protein [Bacteroidota bacterium]
MKKVRIILLGLILFTGVNFAQAQKIGHIDYTELVSAMPETKAMKNELTKLSETYANEFQTQVQALQAKLKKYGEEQATQTQAENEKRQKEVQTEEMRLQQARQTASQELQKKQMALLEPIQKKAQKAVEDVAAEKGILYVLDASPGSSLLVFKGEDLMGATKTKLGI